MKRFASITALVLSLNAALPAYGDDTPVDVEAREVRSPATIFVAGSVSPEEAFGPIEGVWLLTIAGLAVAVTFSLLLYSHVHHQRIASVLDTTEALVGKGRKSR